MRGDAEVEFGLTCMENVRNRSRPPQWLDHTCNSKGIAAKSTLRIHTNEVKHGHDLYTWWIHVLCQS